MFRKIRDAIQNQVFYTAWLLLHIAYQIFIEVRNYVRVNWKCIKRRLWSCFPLYSQERELVSFIEATSKLSKIPKHLAISVIPDEDESVLSVLFRKLLVNFKLADPSAASKKNDDSKEISKRCAVDDTDLLTIAKVVSWASAANISIISLYDYNGILKKRFKDLGCYIQDEIVQDFWAVKQCRDTEKPPVVKIHNAHKLNGYSNGVNGTKPHEAVHIFLYSRDDGKPLIVQAVKDISAEQCREPNSNTEHNEDPQPQLVPEVVPSAIDSTKIVDERKLDSFLNRRYFSWSNTKTDVKTEPDLMMILGKVKSTLGFLPWHLRLSEIHWLPSVKQVELSDFHESLSKYSRCQQRVGT